MYLSNIYLVYKSTKQVISYQILNKKKIKEKSYTLSNNTCMYFEKKKKNFEEFENM